MKPFRLLFAVTLAVLTACNPSKDRGDRTAPSARAAADPSTPDAAEPDPKIAGRPLSQWLEDLKDLDTNTRSHAVAVLGKAAVDVKAAAPHRLQAAAPDLQRLLGDADENTRYSAVIVLGTLDAQKYAPDVLPLLKDKSEKVRVMAAAALCDADAKTYLSDALPILIAGLKTKNRAAETVLVTLGGKLPAVRKEVEASATDADADETVQTQAARVLNKIEAGAGDKAMIAFLLNQLKSAKAEARVNGALVLRNIENGEGGAYVDEDDGGFAANVALRQLVEKDPAVATALMEAMKDAGERVRDAAAQALDKINPALRSKTQINSLLDQLKDAKAAVRREAAYELSGVRPKEPSAKPNGSPPIWTGFNDGPPGFDPLTPRKAVPDLPADDETVKTIGKALSEAMDDSDATVRTTAEWSLKKIDPDIRMKLEKIETGERVKKAVASCLKGLQSPDANVRSKALTELIRLDLNTDPGGREVALALIEAARSKDKSVRVSAIAALGRKDVNLKDVLGQDIATAISVLEEAAKDESPFISQRAKDALKVVSPDK